MGIVEGTIGVKAVLQSRYRAVNAVYLDKAKSSSDISFIKETAKHKNIPCYSLSSEEIEAKTKGKTHGGVIADVQPRKLQTLTSLLRSEKPFLAYLEGVEDNYNLGYIFRTLYAFGCQGVIMKERSIDYDDPTIIKSSAGASEMLPIVLTDDLDTVIQVLKKNGVRVISAYRGKGAVNLYQYDFAHQGILMCVGGPLRGLTKTVLDQSDQFVYIPYANDFRNALNAASAVSVISSEIFRQNGGDHDER